MSGTSQLASRTEDFKKLTDRLCVWSLVRGDRQRIFTDAVFLIGRVCIALSDLVLLDSEFLDVLKTMLTFTKTFELENCSPFTEARKKSEQIIVSELFLKLFCLSEDDTLMLRRLYYKVSDLGYKIHPPVK